MGRAASIAVLILIAAACFSGLFPQGNQEPNESGKPKVVLIAKGDTYLEIAVAKILNDSLGERGFAVKTIDIGNLASENATLYSASIVFNGVRSMDLTQQARSYIGGSGLSRSHVLICTVYGEQWEKGKKAMPDAIAAATTSLNPPDIAARILRQLDAGAEHK
jgi:hypothetical protein